MGARARGRGLEKPAYQGPTATCSALGSLPRLVCPRRRRWLVQRSPPSKARAALGRDSGASQSLTPTSLLAVACPTDPYGPQGCFRAQARAQGLTNVSKLVSKSRSEAPNRPCLSVIVGGTSGIIIRVSGVRAESPACAILQAPVGAEQPLVLQRPGEQQLRLRARLLGAEQVANRCKVNSTAISFKASDSRSFSARKSSHSTSSTDAGRPGFADANAANAASCASARSRMITLTSTPYFLAASACEISCELTPGISPTSPPASAAGACAACCSPSSRPPGSRPRQPPRIRLKTGPTSITKSDADQIPPLRRFTVKVMGRWSARTVDVRADGTGLSSRAGTVLLALVADRVGLTAGLRDALEGTRERRSGHRPGRVACDLAVMLADGGRCVSDLAALAGHASLFGEVASVSTARRVVLSVGEDELGGIRAARAAARSRAWAVGAAPERVILDFDATPIDVHCEKEQAA